VKFAYSVDRSVTEFAVERRAHQLLRDDRLGLGDAGAGLVISSLRGIHRRLRAELARGELLGAVQRQLRHRGLRLEACQIALIRTVEQLHQRRTGRNGRAGGEHDIGNTTVDVGGDVDLMHGGEIADRSQQVRNHFGFRFGNADAHRRRFVVGEELRDHLAAEGVEADEAADQQRQQQPDDDEPAQHPHRTLVRLVGDGLARDIGFGHNIHVMHLLQLAAAAPDPATIRDPAERRQRLR